ncbi:MAG: AAA family ATPase, partial [Endozoicomonadaceae bacterium]|nr:AAA family ATPase [Endozoicomonadaceae bacterium]
MSNCLLIIPIGLSAGSASFSGGLVYLADQRGLKADLFIPVLQNKGALRFTKTKPAMDVAELQYYMAHNKLSSALEKIITSYEEQKNETQLFVVLGLITNEQLPYTKMINQEIATALDAKILFVMADNDPDYEKMNTLVEIRREGDGGIRPEHIRRYHVVNAFAT